MLSKLTLIITVLLSFLASFHTTIYAKDTNLNKARQLFSKGEVLYAENRVDLALRYYFAALDLFPSMSKAHYRIGVIYGPLRREYEKAIEFFHKSINCDLQDPNAYHGLGITYCMAGDEELGSKFLLRAGIMFLREGNIRTALSIYDVLIQIGEKHRAEELAKAIEKKDSSESLSLPTMRFPR